MARRMILLALLTGLILNGGNLLAGTSIKPSELPAASEARQDTPPPPTAIVHGCQLERDPTGVFYLVIFGRLFLEGADVTIRGIRPGKVKFREPDASFPGRYTKIIAKRKLCANLPGTIIVTNPNERPSFPFFCSERCPD